MVDAISAFSSASNLPSFYVSFIVTPFASNASEVISSLMFAAKKKKANLSITYSQVCNHHHLFIYLFIYTRIYVSIVFTFIYVSVSEVCLVVWSSNTEQHTLSRSFLCNGLLPRSAMVILSWSCCYPCCDMCHRSSGIAYHVANVDDMAGSCAVSFSHCTCCFYGIQCDQLEMNNRVRIVFYYIDLSYVSLNVKYTSVVILKVVLCLLYRVRGISCTRICNKNSKSIADGIGM